MDPEKNTAVAQIEDGFDKSHLQSEEAARHGAQVEKEMTIGQALRYYKKAVFWGAVISMATIMESYDLQIIGSFYAYPTFQQRFGEKLHNGHYSVPAVWQMGFGLVSNGGLFVGTLANGYFADKFGFRKVMMCCFAALICFIFLSFFAQDRVMLLMAEFLCSIPWGFLSAGVPAYVAEICPQRLRGYLTTYVNLCWVMGHIIATGVLKGLISNKTEWGWRIPFAVQWIWPLPLLIAAYFAPESPWWLVKQDRHADAELVLRRLVTAPAGTVNTSETVAMIAHTIELERSLNIGTSYKQCFQGSNLRRTEIAVISWGCQLLPGFAIQSYISYFFTLAGLSASDAFKVSLGNYSIAFIGTVSSWFTQTHFGRRSIYLTGLVCMIPCIWTVGFLSLATPSDSVRWAQAGLLLVWFFLYGCTIGPIPYIIASEVGASQLRVKTIALGRNFTYVVALVITVAAPYELNPTKGNLKGKAAFPAGAATVAMLIWAYFRLPETRNLTAEQMDLLFEKRVSARNFEREGKSLETVA